MVARQVTGLQDYCTEVGNSLTCPTRTFKIAEKVASADSPARFEMVSKTFDQLLVQDELAQLRRINHDENKIPLIAFTQR